MRVDNRRDRIGRIMKPVDKFKTERQPSASSKKKP